MAGLEHSHGRRLPPLCSHGRLLVVPAGCARSLGSSPTQQGCTRDGVSARPPGTASCCVLLCVAVRSTFATRPVAPCCVLVYAQLPPPGLSSHQLRGGHGPPCRIAPLPAGTAFSCLWGSVFFLLAAYLQLVEALNKYPRWGGSVGCLLLPARGTHARAAALAAAHTGRQQGRRGVRDAACAAGWAAGTRAGAACPAVLAGRARPVFRWSRSWRRPRAQSSWPVSATNQPRPRQRRHAGRVGLHERMLRPRPRATQGHP